MKVEKDFKRQGFSPTLNVICTSRKMKIEKDFTLISREVTDDSIFIEYWDRSPITPY